MQGRQTLESRFELIEFVAQGGMGSVHRALDRRTGRMVAVKRLSPELVDHPRTRARFHGEAEALRALRLPGVPRLISEGIEEGVPYVVMEWVEGSTLADIMRAGGVVLARAAQLIEGLLMVVATMHDEGWVHGDIKAGNVIVGDDGGVRLIDLGLARRARPDDAQHVVDEVCGTPEYMAPELVAGMPASPTSDLYAVGALLYELLAGVPPFEGATPNSVVHKLMFDAPILPSERPMSAIHAPAFDEVVRRALAKDPAQRYASARQMRAGIEAAAHGGDERVTLQVAGPGPAELTRPLDFDDNMPVCRARGERPTRVQLAEAILAGKPEAALDAYLRLAQRLAVEGDHQGARRELREAVDLLTLGEGPSGTGGPSGLWRALAELAALEDHAGHRAEAVTLAHAALRRACVVHSVEGARRCAALCRRLGVQVVLRDFIELQRSGG